MPLLLHGRVGAGGAAGGGGGNINALSSLARGSKEKMLPGALTCHMLGYPRVCIGASLRSEFQELIETWL